MATQSVQLHRIIRSTPERIYQAFLNPDALAKWLPPHGFVGKVYALEPHVGGSYQMAFTNLTTGHSHSFGGTYLELVPHQKLRYTARFDDPNLPGVMHTTVTLRPVVCGVELIAVQEGIPSAIPADACYLGWQESLQLLTLLVEPEIRQ